MVLDVYTDLKQSAEATKYWMEGYEYIVSHIFERQWDDMVTVINSGERVDFGSFYIDSNAIYIKGIFGNKQLDFYVINGWYMDKGELCIKYYDKRRKIKKKSAGFVAGIPNIHLVQAFLQELADSNEYK